MWFIETAPLRLLQVINFAASVQGLWKLAFESIPPTAVLYCVLEMEALHSGLISISVCGLSQDTLTMLCLHCVFSFSRFLSLNHLLFCFGSSHWLSFPRAFICSSLTLLWSTSLICNARSLSSFLSLPLFYPLIGLLCYRVDVFPRMYHPSYSGVCVGENVFARPRWCDTSRLL